MTDAQTSPTTDQGKWLLDHQGLVNISKPAHRSMRGDEIDLRTSIQTIEREARQQALTDAIAAVGGLERWQDYLHDGIDIDANGWLIDRAAAIDTLTRLRDGS